MNKNITHLLGCHQRNLVKKQHKTHTKTVLTHYHYDYSGEGDYIDFYVAPGVWDPMLASGRYHARYLFYNSHLFRKKNVAEIGGGCGLMSLVMAKNGANQVIIGDISPLAVENS